MSRHTLQWARDHFEGTFSHAPSNINSYLSDPKWLDELMKQPGSQPTDTLKMVKEGLVAARPLSFADCVAWVLDLIHAPYVWYGVKYIDLVSLCAFMGVHRSFGTAPLCWDPPYAQGCDVA